MSGALVWALVGFGLVAVLVRRRSIAVGLVTVQALVLVGVALADAASRDDVVAAIALAVRALVLAALFLVVVSRTREPRPVRAGAAPLVRGGAAVAFALALIWLVPEMGLGSRAAERGVLALIAFGIVLVENGLALAALELPGGSSLAIELGVALDLMLVALVASIFHERIFAEFGAGDTAALGSLRD